MVEVVDCVRMCVVSEHFRSEICENILIAELFEFPCEGEEISCEFLRSLLKHRDCFFFDSSDDEFHEYSLLKRCKVVRGDNQSHEIF